MSDLDSHLIPAFDPGARGRDGRPSRLILFVEKMWGKKTQKRLDSRQDGARLRRYSVQRRRSSNDLARAASLI